MDHKHAIPLGESSFKTRLCTFALAADQIRDVSAPQGAYAVFWRYGSWVAVLFADLAIRSQISIDVLTSKEAAPQIAREPKWWPANLDPSPIQPTASGFADAAVAHMTATRSVAVPPEESVNRIEARSVQLNLLPNSAEIQAKARAAAMFREFDRYTHPSFYDEQTSILPVRSDYATLTDGANLPLEYRFRKLLTTRVMGVLAERVASRWRNANSNLQEDLPKIYEAWLGYLSSLQLTFYRRWFGDLASDLSVSELANAFIWFGSGELLLRSHPDTWTLAETIGDISQGGPDGTAICLFVEFAFAAIEADVDAAVWTRLLPALLAMVEAYSIAYGNRTAIAPHQYPGAPVVRPNDTELRRLRDKAAEHREIPGTNTSGSGNTGLVAELAVEFAALLRRMFSNEYSVTGVRAHLASQPDDGTN